MDKRFMVTAIINGNKKVHFFVIIDIDFPPQNMDYFIRTKADEALDDIYTPINTISYTLQQIV